MRGMPTHAILRWYTVAPRSVSTCARPRRCVRAMAPASRLAQTPFP